MISGLLFLPASAIRVGGSLVFELNSGEYISTDALTVSNVLRYYEWWFRESACRRSERTVSIAASVRLVCLAQ